MINLDPGLLDQEKVRKEKRKHLLRVFALPLAILLIISIFFCSAWIYNLIYMISYNNRNFPIAQNVTETRFLMNVLEPYIADYNQGVAHMQTGKYADAEKSFRYSLMGSPTKEVICKIYTNLSLSIEKQGDDNYAAGNYESALEKYQNAESVLYSNNCAAKGNGDGNNYASDFARDRVKKKRNEAVARINEIPTDDDTTGEKTGDKQLSDDKLKEIKNQKVPQSNAQGLDYIQKNLNGKSYTCAYEKGDKCW